MLVIKSLCLIPTISYAVNEQVLAESFLSDNQGNYKNANAKPACIKIRKIGLTLKSNFASVAI